jgi:hypothetical protein
MGAPKTGRTKHAVAPVAWPEVPAGKVYRRLRTNEILRKGDQFKCGVIWCDTAAAGYCATSELAYRRPTKKG